MKGGERTCSGFSHLVGKGGTTGEVLKGNPPSSKVKGRRGETEELSLELGLEGKAGGWKGSPGGEAAESRRSGKELASCQVGSTE